MPGQTATTLLSLVSLLCLLSSTLAAPVSPNSLPSALRRASSSSPNYGVTCQPSSSSSASNPLSTSLSTSLTTTSSTRSTRSTLSSSSHAATNTSTSLSAQSISAAISALLTEQCSAGAGNDGSTSWGVPLKPNQSFQATAGGVTAYVCNRGSGSVMYCNGFDPAAVDSAVRSAVDAGCGEARPGQAYYQGLLWGYLEDGVGGQRACL